MSWQVFADGVRSQMAKVAIACLAAVLLCGLQSTMVAQDNDGAESSEDVQLQDGPSEQPGDVVGNVISSDPVDVPAKGESDALRRLREGKALIIGPSKSPPSATTDGDPVKQRLAAAEQERVEQQLSMIRRSRQELTKQQKELDARHRQTVETLAQALRSGDASDEAAKVAVAEWQQQQAQIERERKSLQEQTQQLDAAAAQIAAEAARRQQQQLAAQRQQERGALPANATTKIYSLRNSQASAMARVLSEILDRKNIRMAVDERTNSLIVLGEQDTNNMVEALLLRLDEAAAGSTKQRSGETLQLRIVWLLDGMGEGKHPDQIAMNPDVIKALHGLGFEDPRVVCQQVTTLTLNEDGRGEFNFTVPVLIKAQPWDFEGHGQVDAMAGARFNLKFDLGFQRMVAPTGSFGGRPSRQGAQLGGSIYTPLGHYTVMGTTTFVATDTIDTADGDAKVEQNQHLSAFVVYLDRAREFPAKATEGKQ
jgi:hypothetical protein